MVVIPECLFRQYIFGVNFWLGPGRSGDGKNVDVERWTGRGNRRGWLSPRWRYGNILPWDCGYPNPCGRVYTCSHNCVCIVWQNKDRSEEKKKKEILASRWCNPRIHQRLVKVDSCSGVLGWGNTRQFTPPGFVLRMIRSPNSYPKIGWSFVWSHISWKYVGVVSKIAVSFLSFGCLEHHFP